MYGLVQHNRLPCIPSALFALLVNRNQKCHKIHFPIFHHHISLYQVLFKSECKSTAQELDPIKYLANAC